MTWEIL